MSVVILQPPEKELNFKSGGGGGLLYKNDGGTRRTLYGLKSGLVSFRVFGIKMSTAGAFAEPFRELSRYAV